MYPGQIASVLPLLALGLSMGAARAADSIALPVTRVAVFNSGVGYFECDAAVEGDATAELLFRTAQINDIIKSLLVHDFDGGTIGVVSYASLDPIEKTLRSFGVDITGKPTLGQLLEQLRGEPVEIAGPRAIKGVIVGVERLKVITDKGIVEHDALNVLTERGIEQLRIGELSGIKLTNERVSDELRRALATLALAHDADKKSVMLRFNGQGKRKVRVAYLLEAPIWKTSYRLALRDGQKPFLQGWATVENATEHDWNNIRLSLVSGRPISFTMDLYSPIYIPRPKVELELYASLRPPQYEGDMLAEKAVAAKAAAPPPAAGQAVFQGGGGQARFERRSAGRGGRENLNAPAQMAAEAADAAGWQGAAGVPLGDAGGVESVANAAEAGELFAYHINMPVTINRRNSAMLPIVNAAIEGEKVSIFNPATHPKHPLNGLQLTNTSGLNLMQGPVTLFDGDVYAGDAKLPDMKPNEKRLIAYALDLGLEVAVKHEDGGTNQLVSLRIAKGTLVHKRKFVDARVYTIKNKDDKDKTLLIEQAYDDAWKLVEPKEPTERTATLSRFKVAVPAGKTITYRIVLEQLADQFVALASMGFDDIRLFINSKVISPAVKQALEKVVALRTELDQATQERARLEQAVNEAVAEQGRIRENLKVVERNTDTFARQTRKFDDLETSIERNRDALAKARAAEDAKRNALTQFLTTLEVE